MGHVKNEVDRVRALHGSLNKGYLPVDVISLAEIDLRLDVVPFPHLSRRFDVDAAITMDFTMIYVDQEAYTRMDGNSAATRRLRFSIAHELGHYFLHREALEKEGPKTCETVVEWLRDYNGHIWKYEQEANEFAGQLLVPPDRLAAFYDRMELPNSASADLRATFCDLMGQKFNVNPQVIDIRLDREGIWTAR